MRDDGLVKVLDFGLAKAVEPKLPSINTTQPPTITTPAMMTGVGVVGRQLVTLDLPLAVISCSCLWMKATRSNRC